MTIILLISVLVCSECRNWTGYKGVVLLRMYCVYPAGRHAELFKVPAQVPRYLCKVLDIWRITPQFQEIAAPPVAASDIQLDVRWQVKSSRLASDDWILNFL